MADIPLRSVGQNLTGTIGQANTFSLTGFVLQANVTYAVLTTGATEGGGTLRDPDEAVFTTNNLGQPVQAVAYSDNSFLSVDPLIQFTPRVTGEYIVAVGGKGGTGTFHLHVTPAGPPIAFDVEPTDPNAPPSTTPTPVQDQPGPDGVTINALSQGLDDPTMAFVNSTDEVPEVAPTATTDPDTTAPPTTDTMTTDTAQTPLGQDAMNAVAMTAMTPHDLAGTLPAMPANSNQTSAGGCFLDTPHTPMMVYPIAS